MARVLFKKKMKSSNMYEKHILHFLPKTAKNVTIATIEINAVYRMNMISVRTAQNQH